MIDFEKLSKELKDLSFETMEEHGTEILHDVVKREDLHIEIHQDAQGEDFRYIVCVCDDFGLVIATHVYDEIGNAIAYLIKEIDEKMTYLKDVMSRPKEETKEPEAKDSEESERNNYYFL